MEFAKIWPLTCHNWVKYWPRTKNNTTNREYSARAICWSFPRSSTTLRLETPRGGVAPTPPPTPAKVANHRLRARVNSENSMTMFITMNDEAITLVTFVVSLGTVKGAATKLCLGGGDRVMAPKPTYPQNPFSPRISTFILKMFDYSKNLDVSRKKLLKYHNFWGTSPADFSTAGTRPPSPRFRRPCLR